MFMSIMSNLSKTNSKKRKKIQRKSIKRKKIQPKRKKLPKKKRIRTVRINHRNGSNNQKMRKNLKSIRRKILREL